MKKYFPELIILGVMALSIGIVVVFSLKPDTAHLPNSNVTNTNGSDSNVSVNSNTNTAINMNTWVCENNIWVNGGGDTRIQKPGGTCVNIPGVARPAEVYPGKIIYGIGDGETYLDFTRQDCQQRGGKLNTCGSPCAPDATFCITVCALTCSI